MVFGAVNHQLCRFLLLVLPATSLPHRTIAEQVGKRGSVRWTRLSMITFRNGIPVRTFLSA
jgi:hypothetical protein